MPKSQIHFREFALLMALLMSIVALSIDAILPALGEIGQVFSVSNSNQMQWVIIGIFAGMASAIIGASSSILSLILASIIGQLYNGTLVPMTCGFVILCGLSFLIMLYEKKHAIS